MAFGLSPKYIQDVPLEDLTTAQFLVIAIEAAKKLDWDIGGSSETGFIAFTKFSMSSWSEEVKVEIDDDTAFLKSECIGDQIVDLGKNKENIQKLIATIDELKNAFSPEELIQKYDELKPNLVAEEEDILSEAPSTTKETITSIFAIFKPTQGYFITPILINLNIAIYILMVIAGVDFFLPDNGSLIMWGANFRPITLEGEWWRLITNCFLHIGIFHLFMNMYALVYIGLLLEPHIGSTRFLAAYLLTGLIASIASIGWNDNTISAGASGAIFGIYGVFLAMLTTNLIEKSTRKELLASIIFFLGYNIVNGLIPNNGIDNAAHIGGLVSGLIIGYALIPSLKKPDAATLKFGTVGILTVLILSGSFIACNKIPNDIGIYNTKMEEFIAMEKMALEVYNLPEDAPKEKLLYGIKDRGIYFWNKNIKLIKSFSDLDLPSDIINRNRLLIEYCELRAKSYELLYKTIDEDTDKYQDSIVVTRKEIEISINGLSGK